MPGAARNKQHRAGLHVDRSEFGLGRVREPAAGLRIEEVERLGRRHELRAAWIRELAYRSDAKALGAFELDRKQVLRVEVLGETIRLRRRKHARACRALGHAELEFESAQS